MASIGFIGLGHMGLPMALNLLRRHGELVVWNRTREKMQPLLDAGAHVAGSLDEVFQQVKTVFLMLENEAAIDAVLGREGDAFAKRAAGHLIVHMGTTPPSYSANLENAIRSAGGRYVEAPMSGSRVPAEKGELVGMVAGEDDAVSEVLPLLQHMCRRTLVCGAVPKAAQMKLAVNHFLITMVAALAEAYHFAQRSDLDGRLFHDVLTASPMASEVSRLKGQKMLAGDFASQATLTDVLKNARLVSAAAEERGIASPILEASTRLYGEAVDRGLGEADMAAVIEVLRSGR